MSHLPGCAHCPDMHSEDARAAGKTEQRPSIGFTLCGMGKTGALLLYFQGHDLTGLPLVKRKELLQKVLPAIPGIRFCEHILRDGVLFYQVVKQKGLEGIMAKHAASEYQVGRRSRQ